MFTTIAHLQPSNLWANFEKINQIPRGSKNEKAISEFLLDFGNNLGLETYRDAALNVLIKKKASIGFENKPTIILQSHVDMVHQKNNNTVFDFSLQGIDMYIEKNWVKAKGTTLGADNGIGVAAIMAVLQDSTLEHPAIEALFTTDEETGMTGAFMLKPNLMQGQYLLNLDSEEDTELTIGCAGGVDVTGELPIAYIPNPYNNSFLIQISGLQGGHSGIDIHKGYGNSIKILSELLNFINKKISFGIHHLNGGNLRNAIPRESAALITCNNAELLISTVHQFQNKILREWQIKEPSLQINVTQVSKVTTILDPLQSTLILNLVEKCFNGVYCMDNHIPDLVATSNNLAIISTDSTNFTIQCLSRSNNILQLENLQKQLQKDFEQHGFSITFSGSYPGWEPNPNNLLTKITSQTYQKLFNERPIVSACHAGLECGIIGQHYPHLQMISFGPTIKGAHTPEEKVNILSVEKFWNFLTHLLTSL